ncbi:MAG: 6-bladed beta-propeller [Treponema sp.]|nr:6-bladed beta-propeller [Treponema sp.]
MKKQRNNTNKLIFVFFLFLIVPVFLYAQNAPASPGPVTGGTGIDALVAAEEFRFGVNAFNRFAYNEAILAFERALSYRPGEPLILDWLGRAYYRSGFEETALRQWRAALEIYGRGTGMGMMLNSRIETVANRRILLPVVNDGVRYVESGRFPGRLGDIVLYRQPTSVLPNSDGSVWVVAFGSNELIRIDVNGVIRDRRRGPLHGFDRPYDIVRGLDGRLYVSELRGGRVSVLSPDGDWLFYIGSRGVGTGQLVGPQHLTIDEDGYLYVVDFGNRRISKFDPDGDFILSFAQRSSVFPGMLSPTGIAAVDGRIFAADSASRSIYTFDTNGAFLGRLAVQGLIAPESLRALSDGTLLLADNNRILQIDVNTAIVHELGRVGGGGAQTRVTSVDMDKNGSIIIANFAASEVTVMTRFDDMASGFFVQIRNVFSHRFPLVTVELTVEDRLRRPIVGLDNNNFLITENGVPVQNQELISAGFRHNGADISLLVERSEVTAAMGIDLTSAARDISTAIAGMDSANIVSVISASVQPIRENHTVSLENAVRGSAGSFTQRWRFDQGLRLAASDLLAAPPKRSVVYVGSGDLGELAFEMYSLSEMAAFLANNGIVFNAIIIGGGQISPAVMFLTTETGGQAMHLFRPRGIGELIRSVAEIPSGLYSFTFNSQLHTDFGRAWLPLEVEVQLMDRSGRDTTGYFAPLE